MLYRSKTNWNVLKTIDIIYRREQSLKIKFTIILNTISKFNFNSFVNFKFFKTLELV